MSSAPARPTSGASLDQQVGQMLDAPTPVPGATGETPAASGAKLDAQVDAALKSAANLDEELAAKAGTIDDDFADPGAADVSMAAVKPAIAAATAAAVKPTPEPKADDEHAAPEPEIAKGPAPTPTKPDSKPDPKPDAKPELQAEAKAASKAEAKPASKSEAKPDDAAPAAPAEPKVSLGQRVKGVINSVFLKISHAAEPIAVKLGSLSPQSRQTVAWIAVVTTFNAAIVWAYVLLKSPAGYGVAHGDVPMLIGEDGKPLGKAAPEIEAQREIDKKAAAERAKAAAEAKKAEGGGHGGAEKKKDDGHGGGDKKKPAGGH